MRNPWRVYLVLLALSSALAAARCSANDEPKESGFVSLFDGKTLDGWDGNPELWSVVDGAILGRTSDNKPIEANEFLVWNGKAADFVLRLQFRIADRGVGNSGIQYRSVRKPDSHRWAVEGYQADIERTNTHMGILYEEGGRGILATRGQKVAIAETPNGFQKEVVGSVGDPDEIVRDVNAGKWQDYEITAIGNTLVHKINGRETVRVTDQDTKNASKSGVLALQLHRGPAMQVEFRNIRIKPITK